MTSSAQTTEKDFSISSLQKSPFFERMNQAKEYKAFSEDMLTVKYNKSFSYSDFKKLGVSVVRTIPELNYVVVKVSKKEDLQKTIQRFQHHSKTEFVAPTLFAQPFATTADPKADQQYLHKMLNTEAAQKLLGKHKVTVAVVDMGVDPVHPDLKDTLLPSYNAVNPMNQGAADYHGTHVAGIIAAEKNNGVGGYGMNPNVKILPIDVFNRMGGTEYSIAQGILKAVEKKADVINLSLGMPYKSPVIGEAIKKAIDAGVVVVAAAGNDGDDIINYPAAYEGVISVGALNDKKQLADFSTYGPSVDVVAPGEDVYSTMYDYEKGSTFINMSGTSMASPVVAGVVSMLLSKHPDLTPLQVEYILEATAQDLGEKGFDVKYANGMVDPVAALKYDIKNLPKFVKKEFTMDEKFKAAKVVGSEKVTGTFTQPNESYFYKVDLEKGQSVQAVLSGSAQFDYKMDVHFKDYFNDVKSFEVNKVREGSEEAILYTAKYDGTLLIEVRDANGSYDNSKAKKSAFALNVNVVNELPEDESSLEAPVEISELPFSTGETPYYFIGEEKDDDFYTFSTEEPQMVKLAISGVPGVDSTIQVYDEFEYEMLKEFEHARQHAEEAGDEFPYPEDMFAYPRWNANSNGPGEGESVAIQTEPGMKYYVKVTNESSNMYGSIDYMMNPSLSEASGPVSSLTPYEFSVEPKEMPADEDMFPYYGPPMDMEKGEVTEEMAEEETAVEIQRAKIANHEELFPPYMMEEDSLIETLKQAATPYTIGETISGYVQSMDDEDYFMFTPSESGVVKFTINEDTEERPMVNILKLSKQPDAAEGEEPAEYLEYIGENLQYNYDIEVTSSIYTVLEKDETYFINVTANYYDGTIPFDGYEIKAEQLTGKVSDDFEPNNEYKNPVALPGMSFTGNFSSPSDIDVFYHESKKSEILGVKLEEGTVSKSLKDKLPAELFSDFYAAVVFVEDKNKNKTLDDEEYERAQIVQTMSDPNEAIGSVKLDKNKNYFVIIEGFSIGMMPYTLTPYKLNLKAVNGKDEDAGSTVKNNVPSKPIKMKKSTGKLYVNEGQLNAGVAYGDEDWYEIAVPRKSTVKFKLETGIEVDGTLAIYQNGKLIKEVDHYMAGDAEVVDVPLTKGTYHIKVRDINGNATIDPYKLKVYIR